MGNETRDVVFVIGAGASADFGLPLGSGLAAKIGGELNADLADNFRVGGVLDYFRQNGGLTDSHRSAARELADGLMMSTSIDEIIGYRPHLAEIGKVSIAHQILRAEAESKLADLDPDRRGDQRTTFNNARGTWIGNLWLKLVGPRSGEDAVERLKRFGFVTFNYDRCIELFMISSLQLVAGLSHNRARDALAEIDIQHVYGSLGSLPPGAFGCVQFGGEWRWSRSAPQSIKTFRESFADGEFRRIQEVLSSAKKIVFIGYGFGKENNERLFPTGYPKDVPSFAAVGPSPSWVVDGITNYLQSGAGIVRSGGYDLFESLGYQITS